MHELDENVNSMAHDILVMDSVVRKIIAGIVFLYLCHSQTGNRSSEGSGLFFSLAAAVLQRQRRHMLPTYAVLIDQH